MSHGRGCCQVVADHVADGDAHRAVGQRQQVVEVAAHVGGGGRAHVVRRGRDPGQVGQLGQQGALQGLRDRVLLLVQPHVVHGHRFPERQVLGEVEVLGREGAAVPGHEGHRAQRPPAGHQRHGEHRRPAQPHEELGSARQGQGLPHPLLGHLSDEHRLGGGQAAQGGRALGEVPGVQDGELGELLLPAVAMPRGRLPDDAVVVDHGEEDPVGQQRDAQRGQPVEQLRHVQRGAQRAGGLGHQRQPALRPLGVGPRPLGVGTGPLGVRAGLFSLPTGRPFGAEGGGPLLLDPHPLGHVGLHADEGHQAPVAVEHRRDGQLVPEGGAVLAVVQQRRGDRLLLAQRLAELLHPGGVGGRALQEPAVAADDLLGAVAGDPGEGRVDPDQGVVGLAGVGDGEGDVGGDDGAVAQRLQLGIEVGEPVPLLQVQEHHQRQPLGAGVAGQRETGDPQQQVVRRRVRGPVGVGAPAGGQPDRLTGQWPALGHVRQRAAGAGQGRAGEVGQPGRGAPGVDRHRQPDVPGEFDGGGVGVDDAPVGLVDDQHRDRHVAEHRRQHRLGARRVGAGDGGLGGADDGGLLRLFRATAGELVPPGEDGGGLGRDT